MDQRGLSESALGIQEELLAVFHGTDQVRQLFLTIAEGQSANHAAVFEGVFHRLSSHYARCVTQLA